MLFGDTFERSIRVIDQTGNILSYFDTNNGYLHDWYSRFDHDGNLILTGQFGNGIYLQHSYGWYRGFLEKLSLSSILSVENEPIEIYENELTLYPNPTSDLLQIQLKNQQFDRAVLYDLSGKKIKESDINRMSLHNLNTGLYFVKVHTTSGNVITSKVIKR